MNKSRLIEICICLILLLVELLQAADLGLDIERSYFIVTILILIYFIIKLDKLESDGK